MDLSLRIKSIVVGTRLEGPAKRIRQWSALLRPNLELADILLEEVRLPCILEKLIAKDSNVLDIGCHIGSFMSLTIKIAPNGKHIAIEASPEKAASLKQKFPGVRIECIAVSDTNGKAIFQEDLNNPGYSKLVANGGEKTGRVREYEVQTATLDALSLPQIDLVKLDIEGAEIAAFRGGQTFFRKYRPHIIFECGPLSNPGLDRQALYDHPYKYAWL
jgi:FkbM family methyltransferase